MKLMLIIVNEEDRDEVSSALSAHNYQATMVSTSGEFLQYGNTTYLLGIDDQEIQSAIKVIEDNTTVRFNEHVRHNSDELDVKVGRATVFVLDVYHYIKKEGVIQSDFIPDQGAAISSAGSK